MRTVFCYVDRDELEGEGPVEIVCDADNGRLFIFMVRGTDEDTLAADLSAKITRMAQRDWLYVGALVA